MASGRPMPAKPICITFDDGHSRCDKVNLDGRGLFVITATGATLYGVPR